MMENHVFQHHILVVHIAFVFYLLLSSCVTIFHVEHAHLLLGVLN